MYINNARKYVCPELAPALSLECFQTSMLYSVSDFDSANKCFQATHHCCPSPAWHDYAMHMWLNKISCRRQCVVIDSWRCYSLYTVYASDLRQLLQVTAWGFQVSPHVSAIRRLASAKSLRTLCTLSSVSKASIVISPHGRTAGSCSERGPHALRIYVKRCQKEGLTVKPNETRLMFLKRSMHWSGSMQRCASTSSNTPPRFQEFAAIGAHGGY